jgi:hypothetical protein
MKPDTSFSVLVTCAAGGVPARHAAAGRAGRLSGRPGAGAAATSLAICLYTAAAGAGQFQPPDLAGYNQHAERDADGDGDGVKETHIVQYLDAQGDSVVSMTTKGIVWAWSLETRNNDSGLRNYVIRDSDCDGIFDEVYSLDDKFYVPDCLK